MADKLASITEGAKLHAIYAADGEYYPAVVVAVSSAKKRASKPVKVSYNGYDEEVWVSLDMLKSKKLGLKAATPAAPQKPAAEGKAKAKAEPKAKAKVKAKAKAKVAAKKAPK